MITDVEPRGGAMAIISGSHRLVHRWFLDHPPPAGARSAQLRKSVLQHPYLRHLCTQPGDTERIEEVDGVPLQVVENVAFAGDVILMHSLLLHAAPAGHTGRHPRFLLNQDITAPALAP
jgi:ectoine hydroxylase-related dioxygenase (phytanoyl-CoA dioxygenase family)